MPGKERGVAKKTNENSVTLLIPYNKWEYILSVGQKGLTSKKTFKNKKYITIMF